LTEFKSEREFQQAFASRLRKAEWLVKRERWSSNGAGVIDVLAYHPAYDEWIGFELKMPASVKDYTRAMKQMAEKYRGKRFGLHTPVLLVFMVPKSLSRYRCGMVIERFFWRWGFGVGDYENMQARWVNGDRIATLDLLNPHSDPWIAPRQKIAEIKRRIGCE
jgi:hypothetical protein